MKILAIIIIVFALVIMAPTRSRFSKPENPILVRGCI